MDIATLLESHRRYMLEVVAGKDYKTDEESQLAAAVAHDRATTRTLLDLYRTGQGNGVQPVGQAAPQAPVAALSRRVKAGSKAARARAIKAGETRRKNLAAKQNTTTPVDLADPALSPATHLTPRTTEGGAA